MAIISRIFAVVVLIASFCNLAATVAVERGTNTLTKRHDWAECKHVKIRGRGEPDVKIRERGEHHRPTYIPPLLTGAIASTLTCNSAPKGKYNDAHCGNVLQSAKMFCKDHANGRIPRIGDASVAVGPVHYQPTDYMGWEILPHVNYWLHPFDRFNISVESVEGCGEEGRDEWDLGTPVEGVGCLALVWGTWAQCDNKGRGGSVEAGCLKYTFQTLNG